MPGTPAAPTRTTQSAKAQSNWSQAAAVFTGALIELLDSIRRDKEQTIDHDNLDTVLAGRMGRGCRGKREALAQDFAEYLEANRDQIEALTIFYGQPTGARTDLRHDPPGPGQAQSRQAAARAAAGLAGLRQLGRVQGSQPGSELTALVALIRRVCGIDAKLSPFEKQCAKNFQNWIMTRHSGGGEKFNEEQMDWLRMIRDHIVNSFHLDRDDLDMAPFDAKGGLGKMHQLFGERMKSLLDELNEVLVA